MKLTKYILGLALMAGTLAFTSCDQDNEGAIYEPWAENISFVSAAPAQITTSGDTIIPVHVRRSLTNGSRTVSYTYENADGHITDQNSGSVTFADGEGLAVIKLKAHDLTPGTLYQATLTLPEGLKDDADTLFNNQNLQTTINVLCDYNWVQVGTCTFVDYTWYDGYSGDGIPVYRAQGFNTYYIEAPLYHLYYGVESNPSTGNFQFDMDANGTVTVSEGLWNNMKYWDYVPYYTSSYPDYCFIEELENNGYGVNFLLYNGGSLYTGGYFEFYLDF